jgi:Cft2 family RNA processing exonuclease
MSWIVQYRNGIHLPQVGWWLDPHRPVDRAFVSHAHFDHMGAHKEVLCTPDTARLMRARLPRRRIMHEIPFGQTRPLGQDCEITLLEAGHIRGSAQCLLRHRDLGTLLYTGDFKLRHGLTTGPCATPQADVLIMETTFGRPHYVMPPTEKTVADIVAFCRQCLDEGLTPVLMAYSLGKTQELLASLGPSGLPVMMHPKAVEMTRVHEEFGLRFPDYKDFDPLWLPGHVVIAPPLSKNSGFMKRIPRFRTALISGWAVDRSTIYRQRCDAAFPLSDHADYADLLCFVDLVKPKRVLTLHGFAADFASTLRERGYDALALSEANQLDLGL